MRFIVALLTFLIAGPALAVQVTITVPPEIAPDLRRACDKIQADSRFESFTNEECAEYFVRLGIRQWLRSRARSAATVAHRTEIQAATSAAEDAFDTAWPSTLVQAICGNGTIENVPSLSHVEECDDGNAQNGDGCSSNCLEE